MSLFYRWRPGAQAAHQTWLKTQLTSRICTSSFHLHFAHAEALWTSLFDSILHTLSRTEEQVRRCWQGVFSGKRRCSLRLVHLLYVPHSAHGETWARFRKFYWIYYRAVRQKSSAESIRLQLKLAGAVRILRLLSSAEAGLDSVARLHHHRPGLVLLSVLPSRESPIGCLPPSR